MERTGSRVINDIEGRGFNIDHVLVDRRGAFAIETKYIAKRGRDPKIHYRDNELYLASAPLKSDALTQARAAAGNIRKVTDRMGIKAPVRGVVLIPGWFIDGRPSDISDPWVLNENAFPKWVAKESESLSQDDVRQIYDRIRFYAER